jgi:hypothetical protein
MPKRLEEQEAPSGLLFVTGGMIWEMTELRGSARPRIPLKSGLRASELTIVAAAACMYAKFNLGSRQLVGKKPSDGSAIACNKLVMECPWC